VWAWLEFESGAVASLQTGYDLDCATPASPDDAIDIVTEKERIRMSFHDEGLGIVDASGAHSVDLCYTRALKAELEYFVDCIRARRLPAIVTPADGVLAVEIAERIAAEAKAGSHA
jgi:predicted dehydrogenase